jgi:hypothetical protein
MLAAFYKEKTDKKWLMELARGRIAEMEKKNNLPKGKG